MDIPAEVTQSAFSQLLGCKVVSLEEGRAEVSLALTPPLRNRGGVLHGGALFSLVDIAMGLACSTSHGFDRQSVTLECKINYLRPVAEGEVTCVGRVIHAGRRTLVVEAEVSQAGKMVAKAQGTFAAL
ncbi:PaaI family thioesterase [Pseudomonas sp. Marseille-Q5115]|uniref:PaaI family thioesterase n=1 Tax=Pseudomonas sp. Marseille-Q5115 TaxID=2866593 RepID=UPI001CE474D3|nr:PaaI family thioesterase [Pseudomonas sp. Marseille-Q5115]